MKTRYPDIEVNFSNINGNAYSLLAAVRKALMRNQVPQEKIDEFLTEAKSGDYDHLIQTCMKWVNVT